MAKGWSVLKTVNDVDFTETREDRIRKNKQFARAVKKAEDATLKDPEQDVKRLKKEGEDLYYARVNREEALLDAYKRKVVKSKTAIKEAKRIIKERTEAEKKKKAAAEKTESNVKAEA